MSSKPDIAVPLRFGTLPHEDIHTGEDDEDDDEINEDGMPWFYVNQSGFPIDTFTWERMWSHIAKIHPNGLNVVNKIRYSNELPEKPIPQAPVSFLPSVSVSERLEAVQSYMEELEYPFLEINRMYFTSLRKVLCC